MDWDDLEPKAPRQAVIGEKLANFSVDDLEERIAALKAEIIRVEAELKAKRAQSKAADQLFKR